MWLVEKVEIHFAKIGFHGLQMILWSHSLWRFIVGCPFLYMQEKGMAIFATLKNIHDIMDVSFERNY